MRAVYPHFCGDIIDIPDIDNRAKVWLRHYVGYLARIVHAPMWLFRIKYLKKSLNVIL